MRRIPLRSGDYALVDDEDYAQVTKHKWHYSRARRDVGVYRGIRLKGGKKSSISMHRQILGLSRGDGKEVDHIDGNTLNNQKSNLRLCSHTQNRQNSRKRKKAASRYKGVTNQSGRWVSHISIDGKQVELGRFDLEVEAALAYNKAAEANFGEFACLNDISPTLDIDRLRKQLEPIPSDFREACRLMMNKRAQAVASFFGKSLSYVYSWMEDPRGSGRSMPGHMIVPVSLFLNDYRLIEWMANQLGMVVYRIPRTIDGHNFDRLAVMTKEFGEGLQAAADALKDGKITADEFRRIEKEFMEFITESKKALEAFRCQVKE